MTSGTCKRKCRVNRASGVLQDEWLGDSDRKNIRDSRVHPRAHCVVRLADPPNHHRDECHFHQIVVLHWKLPAKCGNSSAQCHGRLEFVLYGHPQRSLVLLIPTTQQIAQQMVKLPNFRDGKVFRREGGYELTLGPQGTVD